MPRKAALTRDEQPPRRGRAQAARPQKVVALLEDDTRVGRTIPAVERAVRVLDYLAAHPDRRFNVSELARRLEINKASCHAVVLTLVECKYLVRHSEDKSYSLGPAVVPLAQAAIDPHRGLDEAKEEIRNLSLQFGVAGLVSGVVDDEILILANSGGTSARPVYQVGQRLPLVPPMGMIFLAFDTGRAVDRWLRRSGVGNDGAERRRYLEALTTVRERGYILAVESDIRSQLLHESRRARRPDDPRRHDLLMVPVFGPDGRVALALTAQGPPTRGTTLMADIAPAILGAADRVTHAIGGRPPDIDG